MRRPLWHFSFALLLVLFAPTLPAAVTGIDGLGSVPVGWSVDLTIENSLTADNYSGQWRCGNPPGAWAPDPPDTGSATLSRTFSRVDVFEFKGGAHEQTGPICDDNAFTWSYLTHQVSVVGPDDDEVDLPLDSYVQDAFSGEMGMDVFFDLYAGVLPLGSIVDGYAQERIRRPPFYDSGWLGPDPDDAVFVLIASQIYDYKFYTPANNWANLDNGAILDDFYQRNRVVLKDCSGADLTFEFAERHLQKVKTGFASWQLVEIID